MKELEFFKLEDRVLFEAAAAAEIVDAVEEAQQDPNADISESERQEQAERDAVKNAPPENPADAFSADAVVDPADLVNVNAQTDALIDGEIPSGMTGAMLNDNGEVISTGKELVVLNNSVADKDVIIAGLKPDQDVLVLEDGNGLDELNAFLDENGTEYSAIHLVTHGNEGYISVNGKIINADNFDAEAWQEIGEHLTEDGDILLYGCNTAANAEGEMLVGMISDASGADVAASTDTTGISGDWDLEYSAGMVDADVIVVENFEYNLNSFTVGTIDDTVDDTDGVYSLREAVEAASDADEIIFDPSLNGQVIKLDNSIEITESLTIIGNGTTETIIDGQGKTGIFVYDGSDDFSLNLSNLTLQNGNDVSGGAVSISASGSAVSLSLDNVNINSSAATDSSDGGGAVFINNTFGGTVSLDIANSEFTGNTSAASGGAILVRAMGAVDIDISNTLFSENTVTDTLTGNGGAIAVSSVSLTGEKVTVNFDQVTVAGSEAASGGAVYVSGVNMNTVLTAVNSTFFDNHATNGDGGAFYINSDSFDINLINSTVTGNSDHFSGGYSGGGIFAKAEADSSMKIVNSIVYGNYNVDDSGNFNAGSDIYSLTDGAGITLDNSMIHSIYGVAVEGTDPDGMTLFADSDLIDSNQLDYNDTNLSKVFGTSSPALDSDNVIQVNNKDIAGYAGTLVAQNGSGNYSYFDYANSAWKDFAGNAVPTPNATDIIITDQTGNERGLAQAVLGVNEFFIGAAVGKVYLAVTPEDPDPASKYDGEKKTAEVTYTTASGAVVTPAAGNIAVNNITTSSAYAGTYLLDNITVTLSSNGNDVTDNFYLNIDQTTTLTINRRDVTFTSATDSKVYDGTALTNDHVEITGDGFIAGEGATFDVTGSQTDVGSSENTFTYTLDSNTSLVNYNISIQTGTLTVSKGAVITITSGSASDEYDGEALTEHSYTLNGAFVAGHELEMTYTGSQTDVGSSENTYTYRVVDALGNDVTVNYDIVTENGVLKVTPRKLQITVTAENKVYNGDTNAADQITGVTANNIVSGDDLGIDFSGVVANFADKNVGVGKTVTVTDGLVLTGADAGNYELNYNYKTTADIIPKSLTVTFDASQADKIYDGTADVTSSMTVVISGTVGNDEVASSGNWAYDTADAGTNKDVTYSDIVLTGTDAGNYILFDGVQDSVTVSGGKIGQADAVIIYVTSEPYFFDGTDQSDSVSAYYLDVNGNRQDLTVDWHGKIFAAVGDYTVSVTVTDPNYRAVGAEYTLTINPFNPAGADYSDGVSNPNYSAVIPSMQGDVTANGIGGGDDGTYGNVYTMNYNELVAHTMLSYGGMEDKEFADDGYTLVPENCTVNTDVLKYRPMTIDDIARENSVVESAWVINQAGMIAGDELSPAGESALIEVRGEFPVESPETLYIDGSYENGDLPWNVVPEQPLVSSRIFDCVEVNVPEDFDLPVLGFIPEKAEAFKSDFEKLLEEISLA